MASSRLRKAFKYPSEDDDTSEPEELDEEHQERLIAELKESDLRKNEVYRKVFLGVPLAAATYSFACIFAAISSRQRLLALLSLSSLLCTAYILQFMPIEAPDRKGKKPAYEKGPVEKYLVYLNAVLAGLMLTSAGSSWRRNVMEDAWKEALPCIILGMTLFVRQQLAPLDLEELKSARYELKGA